MARECGLYLITPPAIGDLAAFRRELSRAFEAGPVAALQIRLKDVADEVVAATVTVVQPIAKAHGALVILNDRPDLAAALHCDGVHIGQADGTVAQARRLVGAQAIVGVSCHASRHLAMVAAEEGADYVAFGAFFPSSTKPGAVRADPEILATWQETASTPCVAIGGVEATNCRALVAAGADFLAVSAGVWAYPDGPGAAVEAFIAEITKGLGDPPPTP